MLLDSPSRLRSAYEEHEDDDRGLRTGPNHPVLTGLVVVLVLMLAGAAWYAYPILKRHDSSLAQLARTQQSLDKIGSSVQQQQSKLDEWSNDRQLLQDQMTRLGQGMRSRIDAVRKETGQAAQNLVHTVRAQLEREIDAVKSRIAALESSRDADRAQIAALQEQLGQVRNEVNEQARQLSEARRQVETRDAATESRLAGLQDAEQHDRQRVDGIDNKLAVRRIDFEVVKGHSQELAPGISLEITGTDVPFRRASGWMWVLPDRRTIWLRQQGAQEPVEFYSSKDGQKRELVITNVAKRVVDGYLLLPKEPAASSPAAASE
jgi:chaperonin cofactor prefoldin